MKQWKPTHILHMYSMNFVYVCMSVCDSFVAIAKGPTMFSDSNNNTYIIVLYLR